MTGAAFKVRATITPWGGDESRIVLTINGRYMVQVFGTIREIEVHEFMPHGHGWRILMIEATLYAHEIAMGGFNDC